LDCAYTLAEIVCDFLPGGQGALFGTITHHVLTIFRTCSYVGALCLGVTGCDVEESPASAPRKFAPVSGADSAAYTPNVAPEKRYGLGLYPFYPPWLTN
jgi:hypothetical protein